MYAIRSYYDTSLDNIYFSQNNLIEFVNELYEYNGVRYYFFDETVITSYSIHYTKLYDFSSINHPFDKIKVFHTDRGSEFKNKAIDDLLETFSVDRSLSRKGLPYDNAVARITSYNVCYTKLLRK